MSGGSFNDRSARRGLIAIALAGLLLGLVASLSDHEAPARWIWTGGTLPVVIGLLISIARDFLAGRMGVDAVALVSMSAALLLGQPLAGAVVAVMYAGGNVLEDYAVRRAERDLKLLVDRAPRIAHRRTGDAVAEVPVDQVAPGDMLLVRSGEVIPVDGIVAGSPERDAMIDESALNGEPMPVARRYGEAVSSGTINAGDPLCLKSCWITFVRRTLSSSRSAIPIGLNRRWRHFLKRSPLVVVAQC